MRLLFNIGTCLIILAQCTLGYDVEQLVHSNIKKLPPPKIWEKINSTDFPLSTKSESARLHFRQGLAHLQATWDFEAYRHFCEAVRHDPDCIMAYWGISFALANPNTEYTEIRTLAIKRMQHLVDQKVATERERAYALALIYLFSADESREGAGEAFQLIAERYPEDTLAHLLALFLGRDGYSTFGEIGRKQRLAIKEAEKLLNDDPENQSVLCYWFLLQAQNPDVPNNSWRKNLLVVRYLSQIAPHYPPYHHFRGHLEYRTGNYAQALRHLTKARDLYYDYMQKQGVEFYDCPEYIQSQIYMANTYYRLGNVENAVKISLELSNKKVSKQRAQSVGGNLLLWEARTLPARFYLGRRKTGDLQKGIKTLMKRHDPQMHSKENDASLYSECLRQILAGYLALEHGNLATAKDHIRRLARLNKELALEVKEKVRGTVSEPTIARAIAVVDAYATQYRAHINLADAEWKRATASSWFLSAIGKQPNMDIMLPPPIPNLLEISFAQYHLENGETMKGVLLCKQALERQPNDVQSLRLLRKCFLRLGKRKQALNVTQHINALTSLAK